MAVKVKSFQVDDLGIESPSYFQGYGVAFSEFTDCCYGIGDNPAEALDDCLEQIASGYDIDVEDLEARILAEYGKAPVTPSVADEYPATDEDDCSEFPYYHIGIKWSL
jgi:hypothetical protein